MSLNPTEIRPVEYKILIKPDDVGDKSAGGIYLPENAIAREQEARDTGVLIAVGAMAFDDWKGLKPKVGDKVIFSRYAGSLIPWRDKTGILQKFRLCNDKDVGAVLELED